MNAAERGVLVWLEGDRRRDILTVEAVGRAIRRLAGQRRAHGPYYVIDIAPDRVVFTHADRLGNRKRVVEEFARHEVRALGFDFGRRSRIELWTHDGRMRWFVIPDPIGARRLYELLGPQRPPV